VVLHTDTRLLPKRPLAWASWNYRLGGAGDQSLAAVTYDMNILQGIQSDTTFCVSLNQTRRHRARARCWRAIAYAHPQYSLKGIAAQGPLGRKCSARNTPITAAPTGPTAFTKTAWSAPCAWHPLSGNRFEQRPVQRLDRAIGAFHPEATRFAYRIGMLYLDLDEQDAVIEAVTARRGKPSGAVFISAGRLLA
jgi:hypothetical protein